MNFILIVPKSLQLFQDIDAHNVYVKLITHNCTGRLQPLDISVNKPAKDFLQKEFQDWYSRKICHQFQGVDPKEPIDLRLTIMKPLGAQWTVSLHKYLKSNPKIIKNGFNFIRNYLDSLLNFANICDWLYIVQCIFIILYLATDVHE